MGLSFSVPRGVKVPSSLVNIYKELKQDLGCSIPLHGNLEQWALQVLLNFLLELFIYFMSIILIWFFLLCFTYQFVRSKATSCYQYVKRRFLGEPRGEANQKYPEVIVGGESLKRRTLCNSGRTPSR